MKPSQKVSARWKLYADDTKGKQGLVGRFFTDSTALDHARMYRLVNWRLVDPEGETVENGTRDPN